MLQSDYAIGNPLH